MATRYPNNYFQPHVDISWLGSGASGEVWSARTWDGQDVAVKYLIDKSAEKVADFQREVRILEEFADDPFIVNILGSNLTAENPYFYMELCAGTLEDYIGRFENEDYYDLLWCMTQAIKAVHAKGKSAKHRDIKLRNILMRKVGDRVTPILSDFDIARTPLPGTQMTHRAGGTPGHMAPELARGEPFTQKCDIFSLGITFYNMFSGEAKKPWVSFAIPGSLHQLLDRMTDDNPHRRPDIWQIEREVKEAIDLRTHSPVTNWFTKRTGGEVLAGVAAVGVIILLLGGGDSKRSSA